MYEIEDDVNNIAQQNSDELKDDGKDWQEIIMKNADIEMEEEFWQVK